VRKVTARKSKTVHLDRTLDRSGGLEGEQFMYKPRQDLDFLEQLPVPPHAAPAEAANSAEQPVVSGKQAGAGFVAKAIEGALLLGSLLLVLAWMAFLARGAFDLLDWTLS
jgi:hypothetical protein